MGIFPNSPSGLCSSERDREYGGGGDSGNTTKIKLKAVWSKENTELIMPHVVLVAT